MNQWVVYDKKKQAGFSEQGLWSFGKVIIWMKGEAQEQVASYNDPNVVAMSLYAFRKILAEFEANGGKAA